MGVGEALEEGKCGEGDAALGNGCQEKPGDEDRTRLRVSVLLSLREKDDSKTLQILPGPVLIPWLFRQGF